MQPKLFVYIGLLLFVLSVISYQRSIILEHKNKLLECNNRYSLLESKVNEQNAKIKKLLETQESNLKTLENERTNFNVYKKKLNESLRLPDGDDCAHSVNNLKNKATELDYIK